MNRLILIRMLPLRSLIMSFWIFLLGNLSIVQACNHNSSSPAFEVGTDGPADAETLGYTLNHFALNVNNLSESIQFYCEVLGMRHVFMYHLTEDYTFAYVGYSHGGKNGTGYQTGEELYRTKQNIEGLLELQQLGSTKTSSCCNAASCHSDWIASTKHVNTFSHIGLIVPDIQETQRRLEKYGVKIWKEFGVDVQDDNPAGTAFGFQQVSRKIAAKAALGLNSIGLNNFILASDPDGNVLEIQP